MANINVDFDVDVHFYEGGYVDLNSGVVLKLI